MRLSLKHLIVPGTLCCALLMPVTALAQEDGSARDIFTKASRNVVPSPLLSAAAGTRVGELASPPRRAGGGLGPVATGALIGAAGALLGTAAAAGSYGKNESGGFCSRCMVQWSSFTVPVGAGIGAAIGYGITRARRSVTAIPMFSRQAAALIVTARF